MVTDSLLPNDDVLGRRGRAVALVAASTFVITASIVGFVAFVQGATTGLNVRVPWYLVVTGVVFVAMILVLENQSTDGADILTTALVVTVCSFLVLLLTVEGIVYTISTPEAVFTDQLVLYFLAAGLLATGFGYWVLNHWREFVGGGRR